MPRYFIDLHDGSQHVKDKVGFDVRSLEAAQEHAVGIMSSVAQNFQAGIDHQSCVAAVRDEQGAVLFRTRLSLDVEWSA